MVDIKEKGKSEEEAWFNANEQELIKKARQQKEAERARKRADEDGQKREDLKKLHWLKCPKCGHDMAEKNFDGITLDECSDCGGLYFDDGELEQLLSKKQEDSKGFFKHLFGA